MFTGQMYLEVGTGALMRMRGQIYSVRPPGKPLKGLKKIGNALVASASIIDFQNTRIDGVLIPTYQSGDLAILLPLTTAMGTMVRLVTVIDHVTIEHGGSVALGAGAVMPVVQRTSDIEGLAERVPRLGELPHRLAVALPDQRPPRRRATAVSAPPATR